MRGYARHVIAVSAALFGIALVAVAWPRFVGGMLVAPYEDTLRGIARGGDASLAVIDEARKNTAASAGWFAYGRTQNRLGALYLVRAGIATDRQSQRTDLAAAIGNLRAGLARAPGASYAWLQLAQAELAANGVAPALSAPLRMSLKTAAYEHRMIVPRLEVAFRAWSALEPDVRAAITPQIRRAIDTAPRALVEVTRRNFALRQVREAVAGSPIHAQRFRIVYLAPD